MDGESRNSPMFIVVYLAGLCLAFLLYFLVFSR